MRGAFALSQLESRNSADLLAVQRRVARRRFSRDRSRTFRLSVVAFFVIAGLLGMGFKYGIVPKPVEAYLSPAQAAAKHFASTKTGEVRFTSYDGTVCREYQFNNANGKFTDGRIARCDGDNDTVTAPVDPQRIDGYGRVLSIRDGFKR
jgi:hypothetical protein